MTRRTGEGSNPSLLGLRRWYVDRGMSGITRERERILERLERAQDRLLEVVALAKQAGWDRVCRQTHEIVVVVERLIEALRNA